MEHTIDFNNAITMSDMDVEHALRRYKTKTARGVYTYGEFLQDIIDYRNSYRPGQQITAIPVTLDDQASRLYMILGRSMKDLVADSNMTMAQFARRFYIPYRTLQAWCDGTNPCPVYIKLLTAELLGFYTRPEPAPRVRPSRDHERSSRNKTIDRIRPGKQTSEKPSEDPEDE